MKIARVLMKALGRPRVALERDGALYDVEELERAFRERDRNADVESTLLDPCDFHTRVATLRGAGLYDLDMDLIRGSRPSRARIRDDDAMLLAPCDTERASLFHVDVGGLTPRPTCRIGEARALLGQDALCGLDEESGLPDFAVSLAAVIGDDLSRVTPREASNAVMGLAILVEWVARDHRSLNSRSAQLGPHLVSPYTIPKPLDAQVHATVRGKRHALGDLRSLGLSVEEAIAFASGEVELRAGDVIALGPLPGASARALGVELAFHDHVEVTIEGLGSLRGIPVPKKPHLGWRSAP